MARPYCSATIRKGNVEYTHTASGNHPHNFVRVDVSWTPGKAGVVVDVKDGESGISQGTYTAPRLAVLPLSPDADTLDSVVRAMTSRVREESWHTDLAYRLACRKSLTWVPERLA